MGQQHGEAGARDQRHAVGREERLGGGVDPSREQAGQLGDGRRGQREDEEAHRVLASAHHGLAGRHARETGAAPRERDPAQQRDVRRERHHDRDERPDDAEREPEADHRAGETAADERALLVLVPLAQDDGRQPRHRHRVDHLDQHQPHRDLPVARGAEGRGEERGDDEQRHPLQRRAEQIEDAGARGAARARAHRRPCRWSDPITSRSNSSSPDVS
ncbi:hypothetical protein GCM10025862_23610 [Arsenicicoccus piscis]|uniref:Uncharacterized protein n=1 Tax=Arsenicicoccus piscis TaxID=673954 RepID=A0ABQ6HRZ3_9MICO|nr:hypothetical protein GCM10025862_23610 [Arsenicicoccus piscis]